MNTKESERYAHESFGQISFSRVSSNGANFYGSELRQDNYIKLVIKTSEVERSLTKDWYFGKKEVLQLRLSSGQFAEMITSMNIGDGVPCTLEYINGAKLAELPSQESRKEFVHRKFKDRMKEFGTALKEKQTRAKELIKKKTLSQNDMSALNNHIEWLTQEICSNIPFFAECFQETMDEVVHEAKLEVENAIQHKITTLGLEELHKQNSLIIEKTKPDNQTDG